MSKRSTSPDEVPFEYLVCRAFRHEPRFVTDRLDRQGEGKTPVEFVREVECEHCKTSVKTTYSLPDLRVKRRRYGYPDGYQVKGGYPAPVARVDYVREKFGA